MIISGLMMDDDAEMIDYRCSRWFSFQSWFDGRCEINISIDGRTAKCKCEILIIDWLSREIDWWCTDVAFKHWRWLRCRWGRWWCLMIDDDADDDDEMIDDWSTKTSIIDDWRMSRPRPMKIDAEAAVAGFHDGRQMPGPARCIADVRRPILMWFRDFLISASASMYIFDFSPPASDVPMMMTLHWCSDITREKHWHFHYEIRRWHFDADYYWCSDVPMTNIIDVDVMLMMMRRHWCRSWCRWAARCAELMCWRWWNISRGWWCRLRYVTSNISADAFAWWASRFSHFSSRFSRGAFHFSGLRRRRFSLSMPLMITDFAADIFDKPITGPDVGQISMSFLRFIDFFLFVPKMCEGPKMLMTADFSRLLMMMLSMAADISPMPSFHFISLDVAFFDDYAFHFSSSDEILTWRLVASTLMIISRRFTFISSMYWWPMMTFSDWCWCAISSPHFRQPLRFHGADEVMKHFLMIRRHFFWWPMPADTDRGRLSIIDVATMISYAMKCSRLRRWHWWWSRWQPKHFRCADTPKMMMPIEDWYRRWFRRPHWCSDFDTPP